MLKVAMVSYLVGVLGVVGCGRIDSESSLAADPESRILVKTHQSYLDSLERKGKALLPEFSADQQFSVDFTLSGLTNNLTVASSLLVSYQGEHGEIVRSSNFQDAAGAGKSKKVQWIWQMAGDATSGDYRVRPESVKVGLKVCLATSGWFGVSVDLASCKVIDLRQASSIDAPMIFKIESEDASAVVSLVRKDVAP